MAHSLEPVVGSTVRDFCMLERNFLAYFKLVLLLMLLSSSALLGTRLSNASTSNEKETLGKGSLPAAIIQVLAALATVTAAIWEYHCGVKDLLSVRAFLAGTRGHFLIMMVVTAMIVGTSVFYVVHSA